VLREDDKDYAKRITLARDPATPPEALERLAEVKYSRLRETVASHKSASSDLLDSLSQDEDMYVRLNVAGNPVAPADVLERLADDPNTAVRCHAAENPSVSIVLLDQLAHVGWGTARPPLRSSPLASPRLMATIAATADTEVRDSAIRVINERLSEPLGVGKRNVGALEMLRDQEWWTLNPSSPEVAVALALFPNV